MTAASSCYTTTDLPRELARLSGCSLRPVSDQQPFSGVVLTQADRPCAAIGFGIERGRVLAITDPVFFQPDNERIREQWLSQMLCEVVEQARHNRCVLVRSLQRELPEPSAAWILNALSDQGFCLHAHVVRWTKIVMPSHEPNAPMNAQGGKLKSSGLQLRRLTEASLKSDWNQLKTLLNDVLRQTEDLKSLPSPDADELLDDWHANQGRVFVAEVQGVSAAVCVCTLELDAEPINGSHAFRIQYIGVRPDHRLKGIASGMLQHLPEWLASDGEVTSGETLRLFAFADQSNHPASDLYRRCGFFPEAQMGLWCRHNEQEPS